MSKDKRPPTIANSIRNTDYEREINRLKRSGGGGSVAAAAYRSGPGPIASVGAAWVTLDPRAAGAVIDPIGSFTENADKSISVTEAGWYDISATIATQSVYDGGIHIAFGTASAGIDIAIGESRGSPSVGAVARVGNDSQVDCWTEDLCLGLRAIGGQHSD